MSEGRNRKRIAGHAMAWTIGLAAIVQSAVGVSQAQTQPQAAAKPAPAALRTAPSAAPRAERPAGGGMYQGITVHGHWVIEVRRPNGKLFSHTEFENGLAFWGSYNLIGFLAQNMSGNGIQSGITPGEWGILLGDPKSSPCSAGIAKTPFNNPSVVLASSPVYAGPYCVLTQMAPPAAIYPTSCGSNNSGCSYNLTLAPGPAGTSLVLTGKVVAQSNGEISQVQTLLTTCGPDIPPQSCWSETTPDSEVSDTALPFTAVTLPTSNTNTTPCGGTGQISCEVTVPDAGDTINVQVTISFSSPS